MTQENIVLKLKFNYANLEENKQTAHSNPVEEIKIQPEEIKFHEAIKPLETDQKVMQEIDQEYTGKVKELENLFKDAKMTNVSGGRAIPNVDFNSYYAFLWYSRMDVCK